MRELQREISSRKFHNVYLFYGEEGYLKREYKKKLKEACINPEDDINFNQFEGKDIKTGEIIDIAETLPFFADYRFILLENTGFFKKSCDELEEYIKVIPKTTIILFVEDNVDKRTKLFKTLKKDGRAVEFSRQSEKILEKWVLGRLKKENHQITRSALTLFFNKTGVDMENISSELEKLLCFCMGKEIITEDDIEQICTEQTSNRIFDMIKAIGDKQQKKALDLYYDLLALKEPPLRILALLSRQFRILLQVKELKRLHRGNDEIARLVGIHSFIIGQYISQSKGFSKEILNTALYDCINTEEDIKKGKIADKLGVELLIVKYSGSST